MATCRNRPANIDAGDAARTATRRFPWRGQEQHCRFTKLLDQPGRHNPDNPGVPVGMGQHQPVIVKQLGVTVDHVHRRCRDLTGEDASLLVEPLHLASQTLGANDVACGQQFDGDGGVFQPAQRIHARPQLKTDAVSVYGFGVQPRRLHEDAQTDAFGGAQLFQPQL